MRTIVVQLVSELRIELDGTEEYEDGEGALDVAIRIASETAPDPRSWDVVDVVAYES